MKRIALLLATLLLGCSADAANCIDLTVNGADYCVYDNAITETGYDCPPDMSNMYRDENRDLVVCSAESERPPFEEIDERLRDRMDELPENANNGGPVVDPDQNNGSNNPNGVCIDQDGDGFGAAGSDTSVCPNCLDQGLCEVDCNDDDPAIAPDLLDTCDGRDNDCDGEIDEPVSCENNFECPDEGNGTLPKCDDGVCTYVPPNTLGECAGTTLSCVDGQRESPPEQCQ